MAMKLLPRSRDNHWSKGVFQGVSLTLRDVARKPKAKRKQPPPPRRPSGLAVALAFGGAIAVAVALIVLAVVLRSSDEAAAPTPAPVVELDGIPQDGTILGSAGARVTLIEYADLQCPACRAYAEVALPTVVNDYVRPGRVNTEFRGIAFIGPDSARALRFVLAAGLQDRLWHLQEALYRNQGGENSGWVTDDLLRELGSEIPDLDVERMFSDADGAEVSALIEQAAEQADAAEITGTPSLFVRIGDQEPYKLETGISSTDIAVALDDALAR
jgi:protein-disulfide isomerase